VAEKIVYYDPEDLSDLATRMQYLEAFSISCFIMLKEKLRHDGEDESRFSTDFQAVFQEAMNFLRSEEGSEERWDASLEGLIRQVELGEDA
jgi:hypothetical protein